MALRIVKATLIGSFWTIYNNKVVISQKVLGRKEENGQPRESSRLRSQALAT